MTDAPMCCEDLSICHVNCQSLYAHIDEFRLFFGKKKYDIICMSETWLRPGITDAMVRLPGYCLTGVIEPIEWGEALRSISPIISRLPYFAVLRYQCALNRNISLQR